MPQQVALYSIFEYQYPSMYFRQKYLGFPINNSSFILGKKQAISKMPAGYFNFIINSTS